MIVKIPKNRIRYLMNLKYKVMPTPNLSKTLIFEDMKQLFIFKNNLIKKIILIKKYFKKYNTNDNLH